MNRAITFKHVGTNTVVEGRCIITGKPVMITLPTTEFKAYYEQGVYAQNAFPSLTIDEREFFISGVGPGEFDKRFPSED